MAEKALYIVSVIIPAHNVAPYLERTVQSLIDQSIGRSLEIILVENGSTDSTLDVCQALSAKFDNVKTVISPTLGPGNARNFGIRHASGKYIGFVDGDDYVDPSMYEILVNALETTGADSTWCNFKFIYSDNCKKPSDEQIASDTGRITVLKAADATFDILTDKTSSSPCTRLFHKSFFDNHSFPENQLFEDHAIIYQWIADCKQVAHVDRILYFYYLRTGSTTQSPCNIKRQTDLMKAQLARLQFIDNYRNFTLHQTRCARNIALRHAIFILKSYIYQTDDTTDEYENALRLRDMLLQYCNYTLDEIKLSIWFRMKRIRYGWGNYYRHLVKRKA